jgi:tRNA pseudouridine55 synthase
VPLEEQAAKLEQIVFHEKLGTVADKVDRVAKLARWLVEQGIVKSSPERGGGPAKPVEGRQNGATPAEIPLHEATLLASVSKGTYIRSLARDIAVALGTVGHVTMLRRLKAGPFDLTHAISLDKLAEMGKARSLEDISLPLGAGLDDIPAIALDPVEAGALRQGRVLTGHAKDDGLHVAWSGETPVALVEVQDGDVRVVRGFNL